MKLSTDKANDVARDVAGAARLLANDLVRPLRSLGTTARSAVNSGGTARAASAARLRTSTSTALRSLPREAIPELAKSVYALRKIRTPAQATAIVESETERLLTVVTPIFVAHPLPVQRDVSAKAILATAGALAAAGEEVEELVALVSAGTVVPVTLPVVIGANLVALAVEIYVAASLRVHDLRAAGIEPEPQQVASDVIFAMTGSSTAAGGTPGVTRQVTKKMIKTVTTRILARWGAGFVPVAGVAYSGWDAQRTVDAVRALPLPVADPDPDAVAPAPAALEGPGYPALPS